MNKNEKNDTVNELADKIKAEKSKLTKQQFKEAVVDILDGELSIDDLDSVAGGWGMVAPSGNC